MAVCRVELEPHVAVLLSLHLWLHHCRSSRDSSSKASELASLALTALQRPDGLAEALQRSAEGACTQLQSCCPPAGHS